MSDGVVNWERDGTTTSPRVRAPAGLTANDFFTGLFAALRLRGQSAFSIREDRFDSAVKELYDELEQRAGSEGIELRFRVKPHRIYGDSKTVRTALAAAAQRRIISFDNPEYLDIRIKLSEDEAARKLSRLPVREGLFDELADRFVRVYQARR